jgi:hypothetical protein
MILKACSATSLRMPSISKGFHAKDIAVRVEEVDERAFLFGGKVRANAKHLAVGAGGIDEDLLGILRGSKEHISHLESGTPLTVTTLMVASSSEVMVVEASL